MSERRAGTRIFSDGVYVWLAGSAVGPLSLDQIRSQARIGLLKQTDLAWMPGLPDWVEISQLPGCVLPPDPPVKLVMPARQPRFETRDACGVDAPPVCARRKQAPVPGWLGRIWKLVRNRRL